jgi:hypothetical protein
MLSFSLCDHFYSGPKWSQLSGFYSNWNLAWSWTYQWRCKWYEPILREPAYTSLISRPEKEKEYFVQYTKNIKQNGGNLPLLRIYPSKVESLNQMKITYQFNSENGSLPVKEKFCLCDQNFNFVLLVWTSICYNRDLNDSR